MITNALPYGAAEILALRKSGQRPADMVLVSLVGPLHEINPVVIARSEKPYDWRFLTGLEVLIVAAMSMPAEQVNRVSAALLETRPDFLGLWFADRQDGLNLAFGSWRPRTKACRRMGIADRRALYGIGRAAA